MGSTRWRLVIGGGLLATLLWAMPARGGIWDRGTDAVRALFTRSTAQQGWVVFPPVTVEGGDLEVVVLSLEGQDPTRPVYLVRFQATDAARVGREVSTGALLTLRRYEVQAGGALPVFVAAPRSSGGWRAKAKGEASATFARWGYLVAGRALAGDRELLDRFFGVQPGLRALLEGDVRKVDEAVFGPRPIEVQELPAEQTQPVPLCADCKADLAECASLLTDCGSQRRACRTALLRAGAAFDRLLEGKLPANLVAAAQEGRAATVDGLVDQP